VGIEPAVAALAERLCGDRRSTREKIAAVTNFFRREFRYSTEAVGGNGREPLSHFLLERRTGHCEYFASGAIALLRLAGVPCRYATGYVVTEWDDDAECWIARNQNAHAWVEAYIAEEQRWIVVEATPGINAPTEPEASVAGGVAESQLADAAQAAAAADGWWSRSAAWLASAGSYGLYLLLPAAAIGGAIYWRQARRASPNSAREARFRTLHRELRRVDRRVKRRGFTRADNETLHRFARRLAAGLSGEGDAELAACAAWYERYAEERYNERQATSPASSREPENAAANRR